MSTNLNQRMDEGNIMNVINSITKKLNDLRKDIYGLYPNLSINDISKIISCINITETYINRANANRINNKNYNKFNSSNINNCNKCNDINKFINSIINAD